MSRSPAHGHWQAYASSLMKTQSSRLKCVQCWSSRINWGGFRFGHLIEAVKPTKAAKAVRIDCADKWYEYFSLQDLLSNRVLMALDMAGKPLPNKHGAPLRLIDPARYGYKSAKLISSITFVGEAKGSMACDIGPYYSPTGDILAGYDTPLDLGGAKRKKSAAARSQVTEMFPLTKRAFLKLAGLSIAPRIVPPLLLKGETIPARTRKVIIVTFGGGVRYAETFAPRGPSQHSTTRGNAAQRFLLSQLHQLGRSCRTSIPPRALSLVTGSASMTSGSNRRRRRLCSSTTARLHPRAH